MYRVMHLNVVINAQTDMQTHNTFREWLVSNQNDNDPDSDDADGGSSALLIPRRRQILNISY